MELQEAIGEASVQHAVKNLDAGTSYLLYLKAYSPLGASQQSPPVVSTTLGAGETRPAGRCCGQLQYGGLTSAALLLPQFQPLLLSSSGS